MPLEGKPLAEITKADIQELIDNSVAESKNIDYKTSYSLGNHEGKKEFLADVSSFANSSGGHLVFGVEEEKGLPVSFDPMPISDWDSERLKSENLVRDGLSPRIALEATAISISGEKYIVILRVPKSWAGPHMVTFQHSGRFYARNSAGKYQLDVGELRAAFTSGADIANAIREFRAWRIAEVVEGRTPVQMESSGKILLHLVPYSSTNRSVPVDLHKALDKLEQTYPSRSGSLSTRFNLDGLVSFHQRTTVSSSYLQLFRDGKVEALDTQCFGSFNNGQIVASFALVVEAIKCLDRCLNLLRHLEISPPAAIMLTLVGAKGHTFAIANDCFEGPFKRDIVAIPEAIVESFDVKPVTLLRPILDVLWNAVGLARCDYYDQAGCPSQKLTQALQGN